MRIIADKAIPFVEHYFAKMGEVTLMAGGDITARSIKDAKCLLVRTATGVDQALLEGTAVQYVGSMSSGIDHIDVDYLQENDVTFFHAKGCNARSVSEYILSCLFVLSAEYDLDIKSVGIIGCGHTGGFLRGLLKILDMETRIYDPFIQDEKGRYCFRDLEPVLAADMITLHVPLTDGGDFPTRGMLNSDWLGAMKANAVVINTSRGGVVNEEELIEFMKKNPEAHLILDVWDNEPAISLNLYKAATLATPHIAGYALDAKARATRLVFEQLCFSVDKKVQADEPILPSAGVGELSLAGFDNEMDAMQMAVLASYDVRRDCAALMPISEFDLPRRAAFFNSLRANYPTRREFHALQVHMACADGDSGLYEKFAALGFTVRSR